MLFSHFLDNVPIKFCEFAERVSVERCYQSMSQQLKSPTSDQNATFDQGQNVVQAKHHNHNRTRWKGNRPHHNHQSNMMTTKRPHQKIAHQQQRTLKPYTFNAVILFFILLLSHDQMTTVNGARSRDSFNSIYHNNNSVNNISNVDSKASVEMAAIAVDTNVVNQIDDELPIIDFEYFSNVTDDAKFEKILSEIENGNNGGGRKLKHRPIYQNEFAVYIPNGVNVADTVAAKHGFTNMGQVSVEI